MINAFITLFADADALFYILLSLAVILTVTEALTPSFGIFGLGAILFGFATIVARCVTGGNTSSQILYYILYLIAIFIILIIVAKIVHSCMTRYREKKKYAIVEGVKIPLTDEGNLDYSFLLGKEGEVVADLKPLGKVKIDGNIFEATTEKEYIYSGARVKVDKVVAQKIVVKKK